MIRMERFILTLLICTSLVTALFNVTRREKGDYFVSDSVHNCGEFCQGTCWKSLYHDDVCECDIANYLMTFSTQSHMCESYARVDEGT